MFSVIHPLTMTKQRFRNICVSFLLLFLIGCLFVEYSRYGFLIPKSNNQHPLDQRREKNWINMMEENYSKTNQRIKEVCKIINSTKRKWTHDSVGVATLQTKLMLDVPHELAGCLNPKAGSTTWETHFYRLLPKKVLSDLQAEKGLDKRPYVRRKYLALSLADNLTESRSDLYDNKLTYNDWKIYLRKHNLLTFSFVRHPYERLVSAYLYLIVENQAKGLIQYHPWTKKWYMKNHSFPSFVNLVLEKYKMNFVNGHWEPLSTHCHYCEVDYEVIGRMETFSDDVRYIIKKRIWKRLYHYPRPN